MRHKPQPATVIALIAVFIAMGGTAIAAKRYLITSTNQIKPSVVATLRASTAEGIVSPSGGWNGHEAGFPGSPAHVATGLYCVPAPSGNASRIAVLNTFVTGLAAYQTSPTACSPGNFEILVVNLFGNVPADGEFSILVP